MREVFIAGECNESIPGRTLRRPIRNQLVAHAGRAMTSTSVAPYVRALFAENPEASFTVLLGEDSKVKDAVVAIEAGRLIGFDVVPIARLE